MLALNVKHAELLRAARVVGVRLYDLRTVEVPRGYITASRFTLKTDSDRHGIQDRRRNIEGAPYRRLSRWYLRHGIERTVGGPVCWHGHRDFLRALLTLAPDAEIRTGLATYRGREHFERTYEGTKYEVPTHPWMNTAPYDQACTC